MNWCQNNFMHWPTVSLWTQGFWHVWYFWIFYSNSCLDGQSIWSLANRSPFQLSLVFFWDHPRNLWELPCFLACLDVLNAFCALSSPWLSSRFPRETLVSFSGKWHLETTIWLQRVITESRQPLLLDPYQLPSPPSLTLLSAYLPAISDKPASPLSLSVGRKRSLAYNKI